ncbi:hypothetical protein [Halorussus marinus]|uniref:hypothetical protein n=1 Tax=Halorussus marinus TaxID=2505976 RepID=UPI00106EB27E|nr:hypothetical protein [Halorussus marinus]
MSDPENGQGGAGRREVAWRLFAAEFDDADFEHSESDEERAPNYVVTPTGARVNRLFAVGVLTQVEQVSDDVLRARIVDPTGAFVVYAGQYQPDEMAFLEGAEPPMFVAVTGKARTFQPEDSDRVFTSVRPESINAVDADTRDRWVVQTAEQTLGRVSTVADALESGATGDALGESLESAGVDAGLAAGIPLALDHYGTAETYLAAVRDLSLDAARVVAGDIDADDVGPLDLAPDEGGDADLDLDYSVAELDPSDADSIDEPSTAAEAPSADGEPSEAAEGEPAGDGATAPEATETTPASEPAQAETSEAEMAETETSETETPDLGEAPTSTVGDAGSDGEQPSVEDADDAAALQDEIGTDEPPTVEDEVDAPTDEVDEPDPDDEGPDIGTAGAGDEMYEFDDEEREEVEAEYGLEFSSGTEVDDPGEADIETPDAEQEAPPDADESEPAQPTGEDVAAETPRDGEPAPDDAEGAAEPDELSPAAESDEGDAEDAAGASDAEDEDDAEPENLEEVVMETMRERNEGDGVARETLLAAVVQEYDVTPADVEDALESALMGGRCYESGEDTLKPI